MLPGIRLWIFSAVLLIPCWLFSFSQLYVFGDSLSDNGNFPESPQFTSDSFYVPFSNPVEPQQGNANPPLSALSVNYPWPMLDAPTLAPSVNIARQYKQRRYRSYSWTELALYYAHQRGLTHSRNMVPSYLLSNASTPKNSSINYAWGSALSGNACANVSYQQQASCERENIWQLRQRYMQTPSDANRQALHIPGLEKQVQFFLDDVKNARIQPSKNSLYAFWIGGNDLISAYNQLLRFNPWPLIQFLLARPAKRMLDSIDQIYQTLPASATPQQFYVFELMNPAWTPRYYGKPLGKLAHALVWIYNRTLHARVYLHNHWHPIKARLVPVYDWYQIAGQAKLFQAQLGQACQIRGGNYHLGQKIPSHNCQGFMYWNAVHPASPMQKLTAFRWIQQVALPSSH